MTQFFQHCSMISLFYFLTPIVLELVQLTNTNNDDVRDHLLMLSKL